jgi:hypothetical protein
MDSDDSKLDRLMKDHKSDYIEDSGFTYRVMGALPRDRRIAGNRRRFILLVSSSLLSVSLALVLAGPGFLPGLFAQFQFAINHPVLDLFGVSFGAIPVACFVAGICATVSLGFGPLRRVLR